MFFQALHRFSLLHSINNYAKQFNFVKKFPGFSEFIKFSTLIFRLFIDPLHRRKSTHAEIF